MSTGYDKSMSADYWPGDRSRQGDCPEQVGKENCFGESFRDWRWRTGGCICDCEGNRWAGWRQPDIQFPNHIERPSVLLAHSYLTGRLEDCLLSRAADSWEDSPWGPTSIDWNSGYNGREYRAVAEYGDLANGLASATAKDAGWAGNTPGRRILFASQHSRQGCQRAEISSSAWPSRRTLLVGSGYAASRLWACFGHALSIVDLAAGSACPCLLGQALAPRNESSECEAEDAVLALRMLNTVFDGVGTEYLGIYE